MESYSNNLNVSRDNNREDVLALVEIPPIRIGRIILVVPLKLRIGKIERGKIILKLRGFRPIYLGTALGLNPYAESIPREVVIGRAGFIEASYK